MQINKALFWGFEVGFWFGFGLFWCCIYGGVVLVGLFWCCFVLFFLKESVHGNSLTCMNHLFYPSGTTPRFKVTELNKGL